MKEACGARACGREMNPLFSEGGATAQWASSAGWHAQQLAWRLHAEVLTAASVVEVGVSDQEDERRRGEWRWREWRKGW